jgi:hypothetical protein
MIAMMTTKTIIDESSATFVKKNLQPVSVEDVQCDHPSSLRLDWRAYYFLTYRYDAAILKYGCNTLFLFFSITVFHKFTNSKTSTYSTRSVIHRSGRHTLVVVTIFFLHPNDRVTLMDHRIHLLILKQNKRHPFHIRGILAAMLLMYCSRQHVPPTPFGEEILHNDDDNDVYFTLFLYLWHGIIPMYHSYTYAERERLVRSALTHISTTPTYFHHSYATRMIMEQKNGFALLYVQMYSKSFKYYSIILSLIVFVLWFMAATIASI